MIEVRDLTKHYGPVEAVKGIDFTVARGELFCFLGPNGAGKTTTIKMLCGLLKPTRGTIRVKGLDLSRDGAAIRAFTGYIPDTPFLYDLLTVTEFLEFTGDLYGIDRQALHREADALIDLFGLAAQRHSLIKDLSHGMRQRLVYASTFVQRPEVLFVDEPFVGLDPHTIRLIRRLLREKTAAGMTIFLTTHILALAGELADRIGIISDGRIVACGTLAEISATADETDLESVFLQLTGSGDAKA